MLNRRILLLTASLLTLSLQAQNKSTTPNDILRRLQLIYPQRHTYEQTIVGGIWQVRLALQVSQPSQ